MTAFRKLLIGSGLGGVAGMVAAVLIASLISYKLGSLWGFDKFAVAFGGLIKFSAFFAAFTVMMRMLLARDWRTVSPSDGALGVAGFGLCWAIGTALAGYGSQSIIGMSFLIGGAVITLLARRTSFAG